MFRGDKELFSRLFLADSEPDCFGCSSVIRDIEPPAASLSTVKRLNCLFKMEQKRKGVTVHKNYGSLHIWGFKVIVWYIFATL